MTLRTICIAVGVALIVASITARGAIAMLSGVDIKTTQLMMITLALCNAFWWLPGIVGIVFIVVGVCTSEKPMN